MIRTTMMSFVLGATLAVALPAAPAVAQAVEAPETPNGVEMTVTGMACSLCAAALERRLKGFDGVEEDGIGMEVATGKVTFTLAEGHELTEEKLRELVREAGFVVKEIVRAPWIDGPA